jgi:hypothetical protein|tara:strand:+ start:18921 stop:20150 length:1230 start_codon:yes stop_codon:yes gene_type:complete
MLKKIFIFLIYLFPSFFFSQTPCLDAIANATGLIGEFIPQCDEDGSYSPLQCWSSTGFCWCVDEDGNEIPGTLLGPGNGVPNCVESLDTLKVLYIGNSYIANNDLPNIISSIANSMGDYIFFESSLIGGATLQSHTSNINTNNLIMDGDWNYIVLQEQSQYPSFPMWQVVQDVFPYANQLCNLIDQYNECNETIFFMTWGRENGDQSNCDSWPPVCTYEGMDDLIYERYMMMANDNNAIINPVGAVWRHIRDYEYDLDLYSSDGSHPSFLGSYVAGVCFYTTFFQKNPLEIPWNNKYGISENEVSLIHEVVKQVVYDNLGEWNIISNDIDDDGVCNNLDNCPDVYNPSQEDLNLDNIGDICDGVNINDLYKHKKCINIIDILGRNSSINENIQIHIFDDGSIKKKFLVE